MVLPLRAWVPGGALDQLQGKGRCFLRSTPVLTSPRPLALLPPVGKRLLSQFRRKCHWLVPVERVTSPEPVLSWGQGLRIIHDCTSVVQGCSINKSNWLVPNPPTTALKFFPILPFWRKWQSAPVFLPGESHGQRGLASYIQSLGSPRVGHDWATKRSTLYIYILLHRPWWMDPPPQSILHIHRRTLNICWLESYKALLSILRVSSIHYLQLQ